MKDWKEIFKTAVEKGFAAMEKSTPTPMVVSGGAGVHVIPGGPCGFAWVEFSAKNQATKEFVRWASREDLRSNLVSSIGKKYGGGFQIWISAGGQSMTLKYAFAEAMSDYLASFDVITRPGCRYD